MHKKKVITSAENITFLASFSFYMFLEVDLFSFQNNPFFTFFIHCIKYLLIHLVYVTKDQKILCSEHCSFKITYVFKVPPCR